MSPDRPSAGAGSAIGCRLIGHQPVLDRPSAGAPPIGQRMSPDRPSAGAGSAISGCGSAISRCWIGQRMSPDRPSAGAGSAISRCWIGQRIADHAPRGSHGQRIADRAHGQRITRHGQRIACHIGARAAASLTQGRAGHKKAPAGRRGQGQGGGAGRYRFNGTRGAVVWPRNVSSFRDAAQPARASSSKTKKQRDSSGIDRGAGGGAGRGRGWKPRDDRKGAAGLYQPECESNCITVIFKTPKENGAGLPLPLDNRISGAPSIYHGITGSRDHGITRP
jgi:hypothetical protein